VGDVSRTLAELTLEEFEELVERTIDSRLEVWLTQLVDALDALTNQDGDEFHPEFAASLRRSLKQARSGDGMALEEFRNALD
jgi:hypothetical protein